MASLSDKNALMQIIGCLMKAPILLTDQRYIFVKKDFDVPIARGVFLAIQSIYLDYKIENITIVDIDNYFQQSDVNYEIFKKENGIQYVKDCLELSNLATFDYYYNRIKKLSALRTLKKDGFNIKEIYDEDEIDFERDRKQQERFDSMSIEDIFNNFISKINDIQCNYICQNDSEHGLIADGIDNLLEEFESTPEIGIQLQGEIYNTIVRGARLKKFYIISGASGTGKSRQMVGHACTIAYPKKYNRQTDTWETFGEGRKILFFATEMTKDEIQTMILAFLSDVNEDKILRNSYENPKEKERVKEAIKIMLEYQNNFIFIRVGDPSIGQIKALIRQQVLKYNIGYVFYDYIFSSPGLLNEYRDLHLREDVILLMLSTALKDLSNELNIFMMSGTQLNDKWKEWKGIRDYGLIRGSRAICDKIDVGGISLPVTAEEHSIVDIIAEKNGVSYPTQVQDIYKVRRGKYNKVRIWSKVDLGTCRVTDLFLTDENNNQIEIVTDKYYFKEVKVEEKKTITEDKQEKETIEEKKEEKVSLLDLI